MNICKRLWSKSISGRSSQKLLDNDRQSATHAMHLKLLQKRVIQKTAESTGDLIDNKIANRIAKVWRSSPQNNSQPITNEHDKEIPKEWYISPVVKQRIFDDLRLV